MTDGALIRIGLIGAGTIATQHAAVLAGFADVSIAAVADGDSARSTALATEYAERDRAFVDAISGARNRIRSPYADGLRSLEVTLAIADAAATGSAVTVAAAHSRPNVATIR